MIDLDRLSDWMATLIAASLAWVSGAIAPQHPINATDVAVALVPVASDQSSMLGWAQQVDEPPIEQVGEDSGDDIETLDDTGQPAEEVAPEADVELLDEGPPPAAQDEDIELLDQGSPPASAAPVTESPAPATVTAGPVTTYVAPAAAPPSGPVLPEGFGTGSVHVSTGQTEFPVGLGDCHVGAVTGRAYVGIDCGDGASVVGHAPSFEEFPFVLAEGFPFDRESVFVDPGEAEVADDVEIFVSAARGAPLDDEATAPVIRTSGASSVEFSQRARDRNPRVETETRGSNRSKKADNSANGNVAAATSDDRDERTKAESNSKKKHRDKDKSRASAGDNEKKSKSSKKQSNKKSKNGRDSKKR